jgi:hypothetical protein
MMNINLNLLPTAKKNRLDSTINFLFIKNIIELFLMVATIMTAILIWGWIFLEKDFADLTRTATLINRENFTYNQDAKNINGLIKGVSLSSKKFSPLTPKLTKIISTLPEDIKLSSVQIDLDGKIVNLNGTAKSRAALLSYREVLSSIDWLTDVQTPTSQLFQKENVPFKFTATIKN